MHALRARHDALGRQFAEAEKRQEELGQELLKVRLCVCEARRCCCQVVPRQPGRGLVGRGAGCICIAAVGVSKQGGERVGRARAWS